jgi:hypothetical protein
MNSVHPGAGRGEQGRIVGVLVKTLVKNGGTGGKVREATRKGKTR